MQIPKGEFHRYGAITERKNFLIVCIHLMFLDWSFEVYPKAHQGSH